MQIKIWANATSARVYKALAPVLQTNPGVVVSVHSDPDNPPDADQDTVLFIMGDVGKASLQNAKIIPKNRTTTSLRNHVHGFPGGPKILFSYSAGITDVDHSMYVDLLCDFKVALRLAHTGIYEAQPGDYRLVEEFSELIARIEVLYAQTGKAVEVAFDTETLGLNAYNPKAWLILLQFTVDVGTAYCVHFADQQIEQERLLSGVLREQLIWLLNSPKVSLRLANGKYDLMWMAVRAAINCTNFKFDTTAVGSLLDENRSNSLNVHAKIYSTIGGYDDEFNRTVDKSRMDLVSVDKLVRYGGGDTDACLQTSQAEKQELLKDAQLTRFYVNILHPALRAFEQVEQGGVLVDMDAFNQLDSDLNKKIDELLAEVRPVLGGRIVMKHFDTSKRGGLNLSKAALINDFMFSPMGLNLKPKMLTAGGKDGAGEKKPSTSLDHLLMFKDVPEAKRFVEIFEEFGSVNKTLSTYVTGFRQHIRPDGRFHPTYWLFAGNKDDDDGGTNTGRLSCKDPAFQCMVGDTWVSTSDGPKLLEDVVSDFETGKSFRVLTHSGSWRDVVGVYRNGVRPTFDIQTNAKHRITCTDNHPILTSRGWVLTRDLKVGDTCYVVRSQNSEVHQSNVLFMDGDEESLQQSDKQGLEELRRSRYYLRPEVEQLRELPIRHGGETFKGLEHRTVGCERPIHEVELQVGLAEGADEKSPKCHDNYILREDSESFGVGLGVRDFEGEVEVQTGCGSFDGRSLGPEETPDWSAFEEVVITSITPAGDQETFDLTIDDCHSFVANGVVVHNTIPKHTKWAKAIRRCYPAPPGFVVCERDYSQGELRVMACLANEPNMLAAYRNGMDLHALTAGPFAGYDYAAMMELKKTDKEKYDAIRQLGKAGNFGLIYGMGVEGFQSYAYWNYGVALSMEEAAAFRDGFFARYPVLLQYHSMYKAHARRHGYVRSPLGRIRHLPLINSPRGDIRSKSERQAINSPVQGCLSDMMIWAIALAHQAGWFKEAPCFGAVHDASYDYLPEDNWEFHARRMRDQMENLPYEKVGWSPQLKFVADVKIGPNMADLKEMKLAS